jgi:hypothetical protein
LASGAPRDVEEAIVIIPKSKKTGLPTVSPTMLNTYGFSGFSLERDVEPRGCPAQFKAVYPEDKAKKVKRPQTDAMIRGIVVHETMRIMEETDVGPDEALARAWDPRLTPEDYTRIAEDMQAYLSRASSPLDRFLTLATEIRLDAELYVDDQHGPIHIQGIIDRVSFDEEANLVNIGDWKYGYFFPTLDDVRESVALKTYVYLVDRNRAQLSIPANAGIVVQLDAIRYRELPPVKFTVEEMAGWHGWAIAAARHILADDEALPVINAGCAFCPIRDTCPEFLKIPDLGEELLSVKPSEADELDVWRDKANAVRLLLTKAVAEVDDRFKADARRLGHVETGRHTWDMEIRWDNVVDARRLHALLGDGFFDVADVGKAKLEQTAKMLDPDLAREVLNCLSRAPVGMTVKKRVRAPVEAEVG